LVKVPVFLAPRRGGQHHVGELGGLGAEDVLHHYEQVRPGQDTADAGQVGQRHRRVRTADPEQFDRALLGVAPDLHGVGRRRPVRNCGWLDVPQAGELAYVMGVAPVAEAGQVAVGAGFPGVLRGGLAIHLQNAGPGAADHAAQQVQVVHRDRRGCRLVRLVEALQDGGQ